MIAVEITVSGLRVAWELEEEALEFSRGSRIYEKVSIVKCWSGECEGEQLGLVSANLYVSICVDLEKISTHRIIIHFEKFVWVAH